MGVLRSHNCNLRHLDYQHALTFKSLNRLLLHIRPPSDTDDLKAYINEYSCITYHVCLT